MEIGSVYLSIDTYNNLITDRINAEIQLGKALDLINQVKYIVSNPDFYNLERVEKLSELLGIVEEKEEDKGDE